MAYVLALTPFSTNCGGSLGYSVCVYWIVVLLHSLFFFISRNFIVKWSFTAKLPMREQNKQINKQKDNRKGWIWRVNCCSWHRIVKFIVRFVEMISIHKISLLAFCCGFVLLAEAEMSIDFLAGFCFFFGKPHMSALRNDVGMKLRCKVAISNDEKLKWFFGFHI